MFKINLKITDVDKENKDLKSKLEVLRDDNDKKDNNLKKIIKELKN